MWTPSFFMYSCYICCMMKRHTFCMKTAACVLALAACVCAGARGPLRVAFVGDPQVDNETELGYARASIYRELRERGDLDLVIILGDLVNDDVRLLAPSKASLDSLPCPWAAVPGNHDRDLYGKKRGQVVSLDGTVDEDRPRDMASYSRIIGAPDTTFVTGGVRFILMDDVRLQGKAHYEGGFREDQKAWLRGVLAQTPAEQLAVCCVHIPFHEFAAQDSLRTLLEAHPNLLLMCGHTHTAARFLTEIGGQEVEEVLAGASCGTFWRGPKGPDGIPDALMGCGAPRGYYIADFSRKGYSLRFKAVGRQDGLSAWVKDGDRLVLNIYGGSSEGTAQVRYKGSGGWIDIPRKEEVAPEVLTGIARNRTLAKEGIRASRNPEYIPLLTRKSPHTWSGKLPGSIAPDTEIRVRYRDRSMRFQERATVSAHP